MRVLSGNFISFLLGVFLAKRRRLGRNLPVDSTESLERFGLERDSEIGKLEIRVVATSFMVGVTGDRENLTTSVTDSGVLGKGRGTDSDAITASKLSLSSFVVSDIEEAVKGG